MIRRNRVFAIIQLGWVLKTFETGQCEELIGYTGESEVAPCVDQHNPRKLRLKTSFWSLFPTAYHVSWVGIAIYIGKRTQETQPNQIIGNSKSYSTSRGF